MFAIARRFFLLVGLVLCCNANAQEAVPVLPRPQIAVVLSGGVARGIAYLGALEVLVKHGVPVDMVVGTSAGAMMAGLYGAGYSFDTIAQMLPAFRDVQDELVRVRFPPVESLLDITPFEEVYGALVGDVQLEDTQPPLAVTATELKPGPNPPLTRGSLAKAVRASIALPIIFQPAVFEGRYYVDGGVRDPAPIETARALGANIVVWVRSDQARPGAPNTIVDTYFLTVHALTAPENGATPDLAIPVRVADSLFFDFANSSNLLERGRQAGRALLPHLDALLKEAGVPLNPAGDPHEGNRINMEWQARFQDGLERARTVPTPLTVAPVLEYGPSGYLWGTRPSALAVGSPGALTLGLELAGGDLGPLSVGAGIVNPSGAHPVSGYAHAGLQLGGNLRVDAAFDPARRPVGNPWALEVAWRVPGWSVRTGLETSALYGDLDWQPRFSLGQISLGQSQLGVLTGQARFGVGLRYGHAWFAPNQWWKLQATAGVTLEAGPWLGRARLLLGFSGALSGTPELFALGYPALLRAYPPDHRLGASVAVANLEVGHRFYWPNVFGLATARPEVRVFVDAAFVSPNGNWSGQGLWLWDVGVGVGFDLRVFGLLPLQFGLDVSFAPDAWNIVLYSRLPIP